VDGGESGLRGWMEMFGASYLSRVPEGKREAFFESMEGELRPILFREGTWHIDYVRLFFAGKIDVTDVPLFGRLREEGLVVDPRYVPAWARDLSYLTAFMSFTAFLGEIDLSEDRRRYDDLIAHAEVDLI
jgi:hypothetical protein